MGRAGLLPLLAAVLLLPGCFWASETSSEGAATYSPGDAARAESNVRSALPAMEAYWADNGTYAGATLEALRGYDPSIAAVRIAGPLSKQTYCLESTVGAVSYYYQPGSELLEGTCANPAQPTSTRKPPAPPEYDARTNVRAAIPAVEAYKADNGTYAGMTAKKLRGKYDYGLPVFVVVQAGAKTYCIESAHAGETFHYAGPQGPVQPGRCPR